MTQRKWWFPLGLSLSAGLVLAGIILMLDSFTMQPDVPSPPGWQVIRPPYDVHALVEQGNIIWARGKDGLSRLDLFSGELIGEVIFDPPLEYVRALLVDDQGALWVGHQSGLLHYKDGVWQAYTQEDGLPDSRVNALMLNDDGRLWVGTWGGVAIQDGDSWHTLTQADGLLDDMVNVMLQDRHGGIWFGSYVAPKGGVSYLKDGDWQYFDTDKGLQHNNVTSLVETSDGYIWAGTGLFDRGGACQFAFSGTKWQISQVLKHGDGLAGEKVRSIFQDKTGVLWFGSEYDGLGLLQQGAWMTLGIDEGLSHLEIKTILQDADGNIWLGTRNGLTRISPNALMTLYNQISSFSGHQ